MTGLRSVIAEAPDAAGLELDARDTLDYSASQHVSVTVISGDVAVSVGLTGEAMDARRLPAEPIGWPRR